MPESVHSVLSTMLFASCPILSWPCPMPASRKAKMETGVYKPNLTWQCCSKMLIDSGFVGYGASGWRQDKKRHVRVERKGGRDNSKWTPGHLSNNITHPTHTPPHPFLSDWIILVHKKGKPITVILYAFMCYFPTGAHRPTTSHAWCLLIQPKVKH